LGEILLQYRDPLFGLIVFFALVFIIAFFSYWWAIYRTKEQSRRLSRFFGRFERRRDSVAEALDAPGSKRALLLLADALGRSGDYEEAISIYLRLQKEVEPAERIEILKKLADLYFRAGFLQRSRKIYEEILGILPRSRDVLRSLLIVYEKLGDYAGAFDVLESLEELGEDVERERGYFDALVAARKSDLERLQKIYTQKKGAARRPRAPFYARSEDGLGGAARRGCAQSRRSFVAAAKKADLHPFSYLARTLQREALHPGCAGLEGL